MLVNIPLKFYESGSYTFGDIYAPHKIAYAVRYIWTKSRAITLHLLVAAKRETPGAQLHILVTIPLKFYESGSYTSRDMRDTGLYTLYAIFEGS